jgi:hypothetical protein
MVQRFTAHARTLRRAAAMGCIVGDGSDADLEYFASCRIGDESGASVILTREIGHQRSEMPIPIGHRALHLSVCTRRVVPAKVFAAVVREAFCEARTAGDLVWTTARTPIGWDSGTLHVFALCDEHWQSVTPPAWVRVAADNDVFHVDPLISATPANDALVIAPPVRIIPPGGRIEVVS